MKFIHSIGQSRTQWEKSDEARQGKTLRRGIRPTRPKFECAEGSIPQDLQTLATTDPDLLIRQYISIIDKIIRKPKKLGDMSAQWYDLRERLGAAVWKHLIKRAPGADPLAWRWKLHPYAEGKDRDGDLAAMKKVHEKQDKSKRTRTNPKDADIFSPALKDRLWAGERSLPDYAAMAQKIDDHLFEAQVRRELELSDHKIGLIPKRIKSVQNNTYVAQFGRQPASKFQKSGSVVEPYLKGAHTDVAAHIYNKARALETEYAKGQKAKKTNFKFHTSFAGEILQQHFAPLKVPGHDATDQDRAVHTLHQHVRTYYSNLVRKSKKQNAPKAKPFSCRLPKNINQLLTQLNQREDNRDMTALIRDGRNLYHAVAHANGPSEISSWSESLRRSDKQTAIKQSEAFERIWRTAISQGARTLRHWAVSCTDGLVVKSEGEAPNSHTNPDILSDETRQRVREQFKSLEQFNVYARLVFGRPLNDEAGNPVASDPVFECDDEETAKKRFYALLSLVARLRNQVFHFKDRQQFTRYLQDIGNINNWQVVDGFQDLLAFAKARLLSDRQGKARRAVKVIEGLQLHAFAPSAEALAALAQAEMNTAAPDLVLPTFRRVIKTNENLKAHLADQKTGGANDLRQAMPAPMSGKVQDDVAHTACYGALQIVYNTAFRDWITKHNGSPAFADAAKQVVEEATGRAKKENNQGPFADLVVAKADQLERLKPGMNLQSWFDSLQNLVTAETRLNQAYDQNPAQARDNSHWVEGIKCAFFGQLFALFLADDRGGQVFSWLVNGEFKQREARLDLPNLDTHIDQQTPTGWHALFYLFLYLVPAQDTGRFLTQLTKTVALDAQENVDQPGTDAVKQLKDLCLLSCQMCDEHAANSTDAVAELNRFKDLFECEEDYRTIFTHGQQARDSRDDEAGLDGIQLAHARKIEGIQTGLRQIMRYGTFDLLQSVLETPKISHDQVQTYLKGLVTIADDQRGAAQRHEQLQKAGRRAQDDAIKGYMELVGKITNHREAAEQVRLSGLVTLHILLMRLMSRLVDFAATWERDSLFVALALVRGQVKDDEWPEKVKAFAREWKKAKASQKLDLLKKWLSDENFRFYQKHFGEDKAKIRNDFAHFNILKPGFDLTTQMNRMRDLMAYDRKLKNSVVKAMQHILSDEGFEVTWHMNRKHELEPPFKSGVKSGEMTYLSWLGNRAHKCARTSLVSRRAVAGMVFGAGYQHLADDKESKHGSRGKNTAPHIQNNKGRKHKNYDNKKRGGRNSRGAAR